jgi:hypothetical protein
VEGKTEGLEEEHPGEEQKLGLVQRERQLKKDGLVEV